MRMPGADCGDGMCECVGGKLEESKIKRKQAWQRIGWEKKGGVKWKGKKMRG